MEYTEHTVRDLEENEVGTVLDQDVGATVVDLGNSTLRPQNQITDIDQPTLYAGVNSPEAVDEETQRDTPAPQIVSKGPSIKRLFTGEEVLISKPVFCIGRKDNVEYAVSHNPAISRKHAEIISRNGRYYIRDLGAKNRIYVNGKLLLAMSESELSSGDVIKLANEDFLIRL